MEYLLKLSKLELKHDEMENLRKEMSAIISFMNILQEEPLETEEWPDETMACSSSALRSDTVSDSLSKDKVLESASRKIRWVIWFPVCKKMMEIKDEIYISHNC